MAERARTGTQGSTCAQRPPLSSTGHRSLLSSLLRAWGRGIPQSQETPAHPLPTTTPMQPCLSPRLDITPGPAAYGVTAPPAPIRACPADPPPPSPGGRDSARQASTRQPGAQRPCPRARLPSSCSVSPLWAASSFYFCLPLSLLPFTYHGHYQVLHLES